jgi:protein-S-isoprenylcysteine O-methyltransferase Ste14
VKASLTLAAAIASYLVFAGTTFYAIAFFGNFVAPRTIDGFPVVPLRDALAVNLGLVCLFALQHSGMARPAFKRWLRRALPAGLERSAFVLASSLALIAIIVFWQPMGSVVWAVDSTAGRFVVNAAYLAGWTLAIGATFLTDHWATFGVRQALAAARNEQAPALRFETPGAYRLVRHPILSGWLILLWAAPTMTMTRLVLAVAMTAYVLAGTRLREAALLREFENYAQYIRKVPMFLPSPRRRLRAGGDD